MSVKVDWCDPIDEKQSVFDSYYGVAVVVDAKGKPIEGARILLKGKIKRVNSGQFVLDAETGEWRKPRPKKAATKTSPEVPAEKGEKKYFSVEGDIDVEISPRAVYQHCVAKVHYSVDPTSPEFNWAEATPPNGPASKGSVAKFKEGDFNLKAARMLASQFGIKPPEAGDLVAEFDAALKAAEDKANGK